MSQKKIFIISNNKICRNQNDRQKEFLIFKDKVKRCNILPSIGFRNLKMALFCVNNVSGTIGGLGCKNVRALVRKYG